MLDMKRRLRRGESGLLKPNREKPITPKLGHYRVIIRIRSPEQAGQIPRSCLSAIRLAGESLRKRDLDMGCSATARGGTSMKVLQVLGSDGSASVALVRFKNSAPQNGHQLVVEAAFITEAGIEKPWGKGYTYRLDKRPDNYGGNQIHVFKKNDAWAYRFNGTKSEPNKYTTPATNEVKDIVRHVFKLGQSVKIESEVIGVSAGEILIEVSFFQ